MKLKNNNNKAVITVTEAQYRVMEGKGQLKEFTVVDSKPSPQLQEIVEENKEVVNQEEPTPEVKPKRKPRKNKEVDN